MSPQIEWRLGQIKEAGIPRVEVVSNLCPWRCHACRGLHGRIYLVDEVPELPPLQCVCGPDCLCKVIAHV